MFLCTILFPWNLVYHLVPHKSISLTTSWCILDKILDLAGVYRRTNHRWAHWCRYLKKKWISVWTCIDKFYEGYIIHPTFDFWISLPVRYGCLPTEKISQTVTPNDQTSLLIGTICCLVNTSNASHLMGNGKAFVSSSFCRSCKFT